MVDESPALIRLEKHVTDYLRKNDDVGYNRFTDFDWEKLKDSVTDSGMKDMHIGAVETAMLVEDHIPGYGSEYIRLFMVDETRGDEEAWKCRQMLHFVFRWVAEEDRHAHCLELWLRHCGRRDDKALTDLMVAECKKQYIAPHDNPTQLFTYTAVQEKATQLFYSCLRQSVDEPILRAVLAKLSQDEARHCHFFSQMVLDALQDGNARHVGQIKDALQHFSMPLAMMMDNYKRKAIQMMRAANGYNYLDALEHFQRLVKQVQNTRSNGRGGPGSPNLQDLLVFVQTMMPARKASE
jgi:acyl-[acyl-carrier-protein] desaturase